MSFILGFLVIVILAVVIYGAVAVYIAYYLLLALGAVALGLIAMFIVGIQKASQDGDYSLLTVVVVLSVIAAWIARVVHNNAKEEERREAARKAKEEAEKRVREEAERRQHQIDLAKAGPVERWIRGWFD